MKSQFWTYLGVAAMVLLAPAPLRAASPVPPAPVSVAAPATSPDIQAIERAGDPSAVIAAYARGAAKDPNSVSLNDAYVRRMVALHSPPLAVTQALFLTQADPANGVAWAVTAFDNARKGRMEPAFSEALLAAGRAPAEPFVLQMAAQLMAWYDDNPSRPEITPGVSATAARLRDLFAGNAAYAREYQAAQAALKREEAAAADKAAPEAQAVPTLPPADQPAEIYNDYTTNYYGQDYAFGPYYDPYAYGAADYFYYPDYYATGFVVPYFFNPYFCYGTGFGFWNGGRFFRGDRDDFRRARFFGGTTRSFSGSVRSGTGTALNTLSNQQTLGTTPGSHAGRVNRSTGTLGAPIGTWHGSGGRSMSPTPHRWFRSSGSAGGSHAFVGSSGGHAWSGAAIHSQGGNSFHGGGISAFHGGSIGAGRSFSGGGGGFHGGGTFRGGRR